MKKLSYGIVAVLAAVLFFARPASAQMIVQDPETEFETMMTTFQTAEQYYEQIQQFSTQMRQWQQQLKDGQLISQGDYTNFSSDFQGLVNSLQNSSSGDTNQTSVDNSNLSGDFNSTYAGYTPPPDGGAADTQFSQMIGNQLSGVLQAMQANQAAFTRAANNQSVPDQLAAQNSADSGVDSLMQTNNAILLEVLKDLNYEQASNAVNMQALLASSANDSEMSAQSREEFSTYLQNEADAYLTTPSGAF